MTLPAIEIYADGADKARMVALAARGDIHGFTTNPSLTKKAGVSDYAAFVRDLLRDIKKPISFEIFADEIDAMIAQGMQLQGFGDNVYVKVPVMNTKGVFTAAVIERLSAAGVKLNITAIFTPAQVAAILPLLTAGVPAVLSIFAGRIADTGRDPYPLVREAAAMVKADGRGAKLLWAGTRQVYSVIEAAACGCQVITLPYDMIDKLPLFGKDLTECSRQAVVSFFEDARSSNLTLVC